MSAYQLQKLMFHVHTDQRCRAQYLHNRAEYVSRYELSPAETEALIGVNIRALYQLGAHPLLLRPFTEINGIPAVAHYAALAGLE